MEYGKKEKSQFIKDEVNGYITLNGWQMREVADKLSERKRKVAVQNL